MKNKVEPVQADIIYPFDEYHQAQVCRKCKQWIRYSAIHDRFYVVSEFQTAEIRKIKHEYTKDKSKDKRK